MGALVLGPAAQAAEPVTVQAASQAAPEQPALAQASRTGVDSYAVREQQAADTLQGFQGGDTVVIVGGTTVVIVVLVVLVIVLI